MMMNSPEQRQIVLEGAWIELRMRGHNLHTSLLEAIGFLLLGQIVLAQTQQQIRGRHTERKRHRQRQRLIS